ncbi:MAG: 6-bladed beta-propeller [Muribaculaceae bacterium]|nr:6-bladed beta-propeller [Muribaculaceae bacterium]
MNLLIKVAMLNNNFFSTLLVILIVSILSGCKIQEDIAGKECININMSRNLIPYNTFINSIDSVKITDNDELFFSTIEDICVGDSSLFLLDAMSNVLKISHYSGKVEKIINVKGHSDAECISAKAITNSNDNVFILDMYGLKILTLDNNLNFIESIRLPVAAMDLAVIPNGFLLFNLSCGEGEDLVVSIDRKGNFQNQYIANKGIPDVILSKHIFTESPDGIVIVPPLQNKLFIYDDSTDTISLQYDFSFNTENPEEIKLEEELNLPNAPTVVFETEKYIITNYLANQKMGTCIYNKKNGNTSSGLIKTKTFYPFSPMVLKDDILYAVYERDPSFGQEKGYVILKYELKK